MEANTFFSLRLLLPLRRPPKLRRLLLLMLPLRHLLPLKKPPRPRRLPLLSQ